MSKAKELCGEEPPQWVNAFARALLDGSASVTFWPSGFSLGTVDGRGVTVTLEGAGADTRGLAVASRHGTPVVAITPLVQTNASGPHRLEPLLGDTLATRLTSLDGLVPRIVVGMVETPHVNLSACEVADFSLVISNAPLKGNLHVHRSVDCVTSSPEHAAWLVRRFLRALPGFAGGRQLAAPALEPPHQVDLQETVPFELNGYYEIRDVIGATVDGGEFMELRPSMAPELLTGLGHIGGRAVGIVASNHAFDRGRVSPDGCEKVARFVRFANAWHLPLVFLVDSAGLTANWGSDRRNWDIVLDACDAVDSAQIPKCAVFLGEVCGMAAVLLGGVGTRFDYIAAWPRAHFNKVAPSDERLGDPGTANIMQAVTHATIIDVIAPQETYRAIVQIVGLLRGEERYRQAFRGERRG